MNDWSMMLVRSVWIDVDWAHVAMIDTMDGRSFAVTSDASADVKSEAAAAARIDYYHSNRHCSALFAHDLALDGRPDHDFGHARIVVFATSYGTAS